jgi:hypothetical protein
MYKPPSNLTTLTPNWPLSMRFSNQKYPTPRWSQPLLTNHRHFKPRENFPGRTGTKAGKCTEQKLYLIADTCKACTFVFCILSAMDYNNVGTSQTLNYAVGLNSLVDGPFQLKIGTMTSHKSIYIIIL